MPKTLMDLIREDEYLSAEAGSEKHQEFLELFGITPMEYILGKGDSSIDFELDKL